MFLLIANSSVNLLFGVATQCGQTRRVGRAAGRAVGRTAGETVARTAKRELLGEQLGEQLREQLREQLSEQLHFDRTQFEMQALERYMKPVR